MSIGTPFRDIELQRQTTLEIDCKTIRSYDQVVSYAFIFVIRLKTAFKSNFLLWSFLFQLARDDVTFDTYKNQTWHVRYLAIERFVQAGRKVMFFFVVYTYISEF